tara:strand:+ start:255 stop:458 length:204 start_codon:yes stop_codon:yes gene_type:complete
MTQSIQFSSISEFLDMGGYAFNVWSVYAIFALFIAVNLVFPILRKKKILKDLKKRSAFERTDTDSMD